MIIYLVAGTIDPRATVMYKIEDLPSLEDRMGETGRQTEYCMLSATTGQLQRLENQLPVQSW